MRMAVISLPQRKNSGHLTERVAEEVRALMGRHHVTQMQLAEVLGVAQPAISKRLRGLTAFDANEIGVLAEFFNVSPAELLGERVMPSPSPDGGALLRTNGYRTTGHTLARVA